MIHKILLGEDFNVCPIGLHELGVHQLKGSDGDTGIMDVLSLFLISGTPTCDRVIAKLA